MQPSTPSPAFRPERPGFFISTDPDLLDVHMIHDYLCYHSYWAQGISRDLVERSLRHSLGFGVYATENADPEQVGLARVISDRATYAYLSDVFILPDVRGHGLGKWLVESVLEHPELRTVRRWALYTKDAHGLYRRYGFAPEADPLRYMSFRPPAAHLRPDDNLSE